MEKTLIAYKVYKNNFWLIQQQGIISTKYHKLEISSKDKTYKRVKNSQNILESSICK